MANLSNINNKFIVQDNSRILVNKTSDTGATLQVGGSFQSDSSVRVSSGVLYVGDGSSTTARIMGFGDYEMITGVSGATYLRVSGSTTLAGTLQAGQYILASGLAYGAVNNYTQIIDGSSGAITGTTATFTGNVGIGTSSPTNLLDIKSNGNSKGLDIHHSNGNMVAQLIHGGSGDEGQLKLYDSNAETVRISGENNIASYINSGNLGIGKSSPLQKLDVEGSIRLNSELQIFTGTTDIGQISNSGGALNIQGTSTRDVSLGSDSYPQVLFIEGSNGNVGIGTTSPTAKLTINNGSTAGGSLLTSSSSSYTAHFIANTGSGNAGIYCDASNGDFIGSDYVFFGQHDDKWAQISTGASASGIRFMPADSIRMVINNSGNVGIGTTSPSNKLNVIEGTGTWETVEIQSSSTTGCGVTLVGADTSVQWSIIANASTGGAGANNLGFHLTGAGSSGGSTGYKMTIQASSGNVGIGTVSPVDKLNLHGGATDNLGIQFNSNAAGSGGGNGFRVGMNSSHSFMWNFRNTPLAFATGGTEKMTLTTSGNLGIGTTLPSRKLYVVGAALIDGAGNTNKGTLMLGPQTAGAGKWSVITGAHYNATSGSGNGSGSAGIMMIGTHAQNGENDVVIGGSIYEANAATSIQFWTHSTDTSTAGGTRRMTITSGGNIGIGTTSPAKKLDIRTDNGVLIKGASGSTNASLSFIPASGGREYAFSNDGSSFYIKDISADLTRMYFHYNGNIGIGTTSPSYNLEIGGTANPKIAITSNINSATSSLYFGDSDAKDRGQIVYTHFGDFMELKTGGNTRVYIESGINTAYTSDGLFNANATPSYWLHNNAKFSIGYMDNGSGLYSGAYAFQVKSTDGIPVTGREIGAIYINDQSNNRKPLRISNQGRININQTNTSTGLASTGWIDIQNGTSAYNIFNYYTGTDGSSGCARYRLDNTSPSFFDFYYSTTQVGYITTNGTDIFYANTSDYRLKEDLKDFDGTSLLEQIQVYDFKWKESDNRMYGVVAHELQEIVPQAVVGNKDEDKLQAVDYSKLVPVLIKSIQELKAEIELLKNS